MTIRALRRSIAGAVLVFAFSIAPSMLAQNLVTNGNFNGATNGWTFAGIGSMGYSALDVAGSGTSGSALLTNSGGIMSAYIAQCVPVVGGSHYDIGASVRIPSGGAAGSAYVAYFFYDVAGCSGANSGNFATPVTTVDTWIVTSFTNLTAPVTANSVWVELTVSKTVSSGTIQANFDRAFVGPPGTTPVSLQRFEVE